MNSGIKMQDIVGDEFKNGQVPQWDGRAFKPIDPVSLASGLATDAELAAVAASIGPSLSSYANVVVVDSGGNGDYTKLSTAIAAITALGDKAALKRYTLEVFGLIQETVDIVATDYIDIHFNPGAALKMTAGELKPSATTDTPTYSNLRTYDSSTSMTLQTSSKALFVNCVFNGTVSNGIGVVATYQSCLFTSGALSSGTYNAATNIKYLSCQFAYATAYEGVILFDKCRFSSANTRTLRVTNDLGALSMCTLQDCYVENNRSGGGGMAIDLDAAGRLTIIGGHIRGFGGSPATNVGLNIYTPTSSLLCSGVTFEGSASGLGIVADASYTSAPFFQCRFKNGSTNITPAAGTAAGSNISF
jgi:hypothetical protein